MLATVSIPVIPVKKINMAARYESLSLTFIDLFSASLWWLGNLWYVSVIDE
jgi:hypothetical protein